MVFLVVLGVVWVVLGVVLEQVEAVAKPLLVPVLKKPPPGPPKPPPGPPKTPPGPIYDFNRKIRRLVRRVSGVLRREIVIKSIGIEIVVKSSLIDRHRNRH